ncbi:HoxN/HupN/NixA family nickel/cobalt transporter [Noviherbaspirillum pedocola]|uniref:Nickel/cobalt efflux system n=1 Tax=Noviherbaspirillum pedocola TaxID=2801341 RepID=A0A934ST39_9BURK|nr:HoxN/HupN/NixA family nickel/cobalt transporter [Noviherbaspirillum pedocola]MBK4735112.1 HoxN/HupN/NixA family nickel/cobalt transporter [Noviherbaspirillum pedocola]
MSAIGLPASAHLRADMGIDAKLRRMAMFLGAANILVWAWAWFALREEGALLGTAALAYGFGLRHALDADHIAAIDNVTRKLMQDGQRPAAVGFFFALGHSMVVVLAAVLVAYAARSFGSWLPRLQEYGGLLSACISTSFLMLIGLFNVFVLASLYRMHRRIRRGMRVNEEPAAIRGNLLARLCIPLFARIRHSWQMIPLGFLFGLGFETATEVTLLSTSALHAAQGASIATVLLFPALFTVGMLTLDAADGILMLRLYGWALAHPARKLYYNMALTFLSMLLAFVIAALGITGLIGEHWQLEGGIWDAVHVAQQNMLTLGYIIIGVFLLSWIVSRWSDRFKSDNNI